MSAGRSSQVGPAYRSHSGTFAVYKGRKQGRQIWRWKTVAKNSRKTASGGEAYVNEADAVTGALTTARIIAEAHGYQLVKKG